MRAEKEQKRSLPNWGCYTQGSHWMRQTSWRIDSIAGIRRRHFIYASLKYSGFSIIF